MNSNQDELDLGGYGLAYGPLSLNLLKKAFKTLVITLMNKLSSLKISKNIYFLIGNLVLQENVHM